MPRSSTLATLAAVALAAAAPAVAAVKTEAVTYRAGDTELRGFLAWDEATTGKRPGVLVVHEWWGLNDYARGRAEQLAALGYVAFALDMYGDGKVTDKPEEAGHWSSMVGQNREEALGRARAGLDVLAANPHVDKDKIAAIGYCFGGSVVVHLAYAGFPLRGVVSFHGSLPLPPEGQGKIDVPILVAHGASDTFIAPEQVRQFAEALTAHGANWQMNAYGGAVHSFTVPGAETRGIPGLAYNEQADRRSWQEMQDFFAEVLGK